MAAKEDDAYLEIHVRDDSKLVEVWLTHAENRDEALRERLKPLYQRYKYENYMVAVFQSGERDLVEETSTLLCHNRRRLAQLEVQRESGQGMEIRV